MSIRVIVSGGQTGVDRAALDAARALGIAIDGWCPRGRWAEDGAIPPEYPLRETTSPNPAKRTRANVCDCDATLVLTSGAPDGGTSLTIKLARASGKPHLIVDLADADPGEIGRWIAAIRPARLNVAGPRESKVPGIYARARALLLDALYVAFDDRLDQHPRL